jgi:hypothetical protein
MIKLSDLEHQNKLLKAQENVGAHANYLMDILKPAIERGNCDELESLDIGFTVSGESLGKIDDDEAWRNLQPYFEPRAKKAITINFTLDGKVIERNLKNQLKTLLLKMMWLSAYSGAIQPPIPGLSGHPFRFKPDTISGINQPFFALTPESVSG